MQISAVITVKSISANISVTIRDIKMIYVSTPMFEGVQNQDKPFKLTYFEY